MDKAKKEHQLTVSVSPHIKSEETTSRIMWSVNAALLPATVMGAYFFGPRAVFILAIAIIAAVLSEYIFQKSLNRKISVNDGSAFLTGLLLGMNLPPSVPFYIPIVGSFAAIVITKQLFGGLGFNVFNPALIGRAFLLISFPKLMTIWKEPTAAFIQFDAKTTATPLGILKEEGVAKLMEMFGDNITLYTQLFTGHRAGSIGETSSIALLIGAAFLLYRGYISWHIPVSFLGTAALMAWIFGTKGALFTGDPIVHLLSGGMLLGAFFMATDYVTCPSVRKGQILFGIGCGFLTMLIRLKGGYPEGVMFAILIMNCFSPIIDRGFRTKVFGAKKEIKESKK
ncbi:MAG: electron transporter RnfD [Nitrospirae bacterium GWC2_46_6]|nr:MAG: electron transporter RnfD [Nitrospirae bacterium GWC2_46_6]OGW20280.1 MAG: electron transporter RnfD [Nitrospirae bacterium GWA2_46_11]OGW25209.1 MAG: electron transporter RnfD [Nitrospirae bacterium GWB2_47_37]HAK88010.1 electron transporter RnfD [Nitrospiraceae bacterium]HCL81678.1 electron transporter RnfD [Nitrospiraceae bacterium]